MCKNCRYLNNKGYSEIFQCIYLITVIKTDVYGKFKSGIFIISMRNAVQHS